jgi:queuine/archaeosine tRNA-ribosyltransferase
MSDRYAQILPESVRRLETASGAIEYPAYIPVTTFGSKYPLDELIQPYLPRLAPAVMVSFHYAQSMKKKPRIPVLIDSGGFAALFEGSQIVEEHGLGVLRVKAETDVDELTPHRLLDFQERHADIAFTLDFPIPPGMERPEADRRMHLTVKNAIWALKNRRRKELKLFACIQGLTAPDYMNVAQELAAQDFDGFAIGGLVPRVRDEKLIDALIPSVLDQIGERPLHVFGLGKPDTTRWLFRLGVDSVDSSSYVKLAADGRLWSDPKKRILDPSPMHRLHLALCNLAEATGKTLPLSTSRLVFSTHVLHRDARS